MQRIDNSTASTTLPTPKPIGTPGFFTPGTVGGQAATIVEADWLNQVQEELIAILAADGLTPSKTSNNQVITAILDLIAQNTRKRLTGPLDLYVATTGSDTNNGLTPSAPFATPQAAWNYIIDRLDCASQQIAVHIADGTYGPLFCRGQPVGGNGTGIYFQGDIANPHAVTFASSTPQTHAMTLIDGAMAYVQGINFVTTATGAYSIYAWGAQCFMQNCNFGACVMSHLCADEGAMITITGSYTIDGGAVSHLESAHGGLVTVNTNQGPLAAVTLSGTPTFTTAFAYCQGAASINLVPAQIHFVGGAHGQRYNSSYNGAIMTSGGGASYFPGDVAGTADPATFGTYQP